MSKSFATFTIRIITGTIMFLALSPLAITSPANAHTYCVTYRHWVGWGGYYGVPWTYSRFFDNPYVFRCSDAYLYAAPPRGAPVK